MPLSVSAIPVSLLNHYRIRDLSQRVAAVIVQHHPEESPHKEVASQLTIHSTALGHAMDRETGSALTGEINQVDCDRDDTARGLFSGVEFHKRHFDASYREGAEMLWDILMRQNSRIHNEPDAVETQMIDTLLAELAVPEAVAALSLLALDGFVSLLKEQNKSFRTLTNRRAELESMKEIPLIAPTRSLLHQSLRAMGESFTLLNRSGTGSMDGAIEQINKHITEVVALARTEATRSE